MTWALSDIFEHFLPYPGKMCANMIKISFYHGRRCIAVHRGTLRDKKVGKKWATAWTGTSDKS